MAVLPIAAVIGIVVGAIALVYLLLGGMGEGDAGANATTTASPSATPSASASPAASDGASPGAGGSSTSTVAPGAVDKTITLDVFNGTSPSVSGLAKKAATKLTTAGWTTDRIETWTGTPVTQTTVYYGTESQRASALSVVRTLGRGTAKLSPSKAGAGMAVVISNDYPGGGVARSTGRSSGANVSKSTTRSATAGAGETGSPRPTSPTASQTSQEDPTQGAGRGRTGPTATTSASPNN